MAIAAELDVSLVYSKNQKENLDTDNKRNELMKVEIIQAVYSFSQKATHSYNCTRCCKSTILTQTNKRDVVVHF